MAPALLLLAQRDGIGAATSEIALGVLAVVLPLIWFATRPGSSVDKVAAPAVSNRRELWSDANFWSLAAPFALAMAAQVGVLVYQVSYLLPLLGADGASVAVICVGLSALVSRLLLGAVVDRLAPRRVSAAIFVVQAISTTILLGFPRHPAALYLSSVLLGAAAGTILTPPSLIIQREFPSASFGAVLGLAMAIAQFVAGLIPVLLGAVYDAAGNYGAVFGICIALPLMAVALVLRPIPPQPSPQMPATGP